MERKLITTIINDRNSYTQLAPLNIQSELSEPAKLIYNEIERFYNNDSEAKTCDVELIKSAIERKYPKHYQAINMTLDGLEETSPVNVVEEFVELRKKNLGMKLSSALLNGDSRLIEPLLSEYRDISDATTFTREENNEIFRGIDISALGVSEEREFSLYPKALQDRTNGADRGHHILIFARPEVGKSMISINMASMFAKNGHKVLYIGNEDPPRDMLFRFLNRLTGRNKREILANIDEAQKLAKENGYDDIIFASLAPGTISEIRGLIEKYEPDVVFIDQIRNLSMKEDGLVHILEKAATEIRNIAKKYNVLAVSVTQAGDSATNKLVLSMSDVDSSKTGLPAQLDLMIGVGSNGEFETSNRRMLSMPKNKLSGDHSFFPVQVDPSLSKVNSI